DSLDTSEIEHSQGEQPKGRALCCCVPLDPPRADRDAQLRILIRIARYDAPGVLRSLRASVPSKTTAPLSIVKVDPPSGVLDPEETPLLSAVSSKSPTPSG